MEMQLPRSIKGLQWLTKRVATLNHFISWSTDRCLLFFKTLWKTFDWIECEKAF